MMNSPAPLPVRSPGLRRFKSRAFEVLCMAVAAMAVVVLVVLLGSVALQGGPKLSWHFISSMTSSGAEETGLLPPLVGSAAVCLICMLSAIPLGVGTAILLEEFPPRHRFLKFLHSGLNTNISNLAGVPSIVYGILGVTVFAGAFGLFNGPDRRTPEIGVQWFNQYSLADGRTLFTPADGPLPTTAAGLMKLALHECQADGCAEAEAAELRALGALVAAKAARAANAAVQAQLAKDERTLPAELDALLRAAADHANAVLAGLPPADQAQLPAQAAQAADRLGALEARLNDDAGKFEVAAKLSEDAAANEHLTAAEALLHQIIGGLREDAKDAVQAALGAHGGRTYLQPTEETRWYGGDIGYAKAKAVRLDFQTAADAAQLEQGDRQLAAFEEHYRTAVDAARTGERHTGPVQVTEAEAQTAAKDALAAAGLADGALAAPVTQAFLALNGKEGSELRRARSAAVRAVESRLAAGRAAIQQKIAPGLAPQRVRQTLWYHLALPLGQGVLAGGLTLMLVVLPIVVVATQEALRAVAPSIRQGALGLGATQWQSVSHTVLPAAVPGICTGVILALARALGEAAPILILGGVVYVTFLPSHLMDSFTVLPLQIFQWASLPQAEFRAVAAAGILVLMILLLAFNALAMVIRHRTQKHG